MPDGWTITELNRYVRQSLESDWRLQNVRVWGEISGFKAYPSGHWYFSLKDARAQVNCVMWRTRAERQSYLPRDGDAVEAHGNVTLYEARGQFQLDVAWLQLAGEGELYREFVRLKARLEAEGLFDPARKRPLPTRPQIIGLVTSPAGAALRDVLNVLRRRTPLAHVILSPTPVQGAEAPPQIVQALQACASCSPRPEVIIVARGGGSLEDLWGFNDEAVVRAIAESPIPVVSGVGHETDVTLADFVADLRAPTPSAAAELVSAISADDLRVWLRQQTERLAEAMGRIVDAQRWSLAEKQAHLTGLSPHALVRNARQRLDDLSTRTAVALVHRSKLERERVNRLTQALNNVSPVVVLSRGYALVTDTDGAVVRSASAVQPGDPLHVRVDEGEFGVEVVGETGSSHELQIQT